MNIPVRLVRNFRFSFETAAYTYICTVYMYIYRSIQGERGIMTYDPFWKNFGVLPNIVVGVWILHDLPFYIILEVKTAVVRYGVAWDKRGQGHHDHQWWPVRGKIEKIEKVTMNLSKQRYNAQPVHVYAHAACPCPCCMLISMLMLHVHVYAACPCPCCMSMSKLHVHVHAASPFPYCTAHAAYPYSWSYCMLLPHGAFLWGKC